MHFPRRSYLSVSSRVKLVTCPLGSITGTGHGVLIANCRASAVDERETELIKLFQPIFVHLQIHVVSAPNQKHFIVECKRAHLSSVLVKAAWRRDARDCFGFVKLIAAQIPRQFDLWRHRIQLGSKGWFVMRTKNEHINIVALLTLVIGTRATALTVLHAGTLANGRHVDVVAKFPATIVKSIACAYATMMLIDEFVIAIEEVGVEMVLACDAIR